ncbi:OMP_b-brl domain-containing protein [Vibrio jasicida]|uniref:outer membrane beta-barrel protein n=1 Tax=Vibrio jasicida TaxID=766224 RepID=UPI0028957B1B|nr:OMP_b-brl domain-containing protein [Vibrio jasicida]
MRYSLVTALVLSTLSLSAHATTNKHIVGTNLGYGAVNYDAPTSEESGDMFLGEVYYRYMLTQNIGIEAGFKGAFDGIGSILVSPISEVTDTSFSGPRLSGYASYPLGAGFELYGKAGVTAYTLEYTYKVNGQSRNIEESSIGGEAAAGIGWSYKHLGLNAEYVYSKNRDFDSGGVMFGAQVRF